MIRLCFLFILAFFSHAFGEERALFSEKTAPLLISLSKIYPEANRFEETIGCFLNGLISLEQEDLVAVSAKVNQCKVLILADGGANSFVALYNACEKIGIKITAIPICLIGDLDSVTVESEQFLKVRFPEMKVMKFCRDKDFTDLEAAIQVLQLDAIDQVYLFSAIGKRIDHELGNIFYLLRQENKGKVTIFHSEGGNSQVLFTVISNQTKKFSAQKGQTISLIPLSGPVFGIKTSGLHWDLDLPRFDETICGISNIANAEEVTISVERGSMLCIVNDFIDEDMYERVEG